MHFNSALKVLLDVPLPQSPSIQQELANSHNRRSMAGPGDPKEGCTTFPQEGVKELVSKLGELDPVAATEQESLESLERVEMVQERKCKPCQTWRGKSAESGATSLLNLARLARQVCMTRPK